MRCRNLLRRWVFGAATVLLAGVQGWLPAGEAARPNIVFILADDLGYGDLGCYGATRIETPHIDSLAEHGMRFTDAYASSSVCTPTRYALLTGIYPWRVPRQDNRLLWATHLAGSLIREGQPTLASVLKRAGYTNGMIGKWHLGLGPFGQPRDWNGELKPGPLELGFDYFFGDPYNRFTFYIENHRVAGLGPNQRIERSGQDLVLPDSVWRIDETGNGRVLTEKACAFIRRAASRPPFFLYYAPNHPHRPLTPAKAFRGSSRAGLYGDFVQELDWSVGQVLEALRETGTLDQTLVFFTSDNGGVHTSSSLEAGHRTNGPLLGQKSDVWEGGMRVPFIARWTGVIPEGRQSGVPICLTDMMATLTELVEVPPAGGAVQDGMSLLGVLKGAEPAEALLERALVLNVGRRTRPFVVRKGDWVYINRQGSGGVSAPAGEDWPIPGAFRFARCGFENSDINPDGTIKPGAPAAQLYNLRLDPSQKTNVILQHQEKARELEGLLRAAREATDQLKWRIPPD